MCHERLGAPRCLVPSTKLDGTTGGCVPRLGVQGCRTLSCSTKRQRVAARVIRELAAEGAIIDGITGHDIAPQKEYAASERGWMVLRRFGDLHRIQRLLDAGSGFGSGFGRVTRFVVRELPLERVWVAETPALLLARPLESLLLRSGRCSRCSGSTTVPPRMRATSDRGQLFGLPLGGLNRAVGRTARRSGASSTRHDCACSPRSGTPFKTSGDVSVSVVKLARWRRSQPAPRGGRARPEWRTNALLGPSRAASLSLAWAQARDRPAGVSPFAVNAEGAWTCKRGQLTAP
jgi:hypothetical protein